MIKFSDFDFLSLAFSTRSSILLTVDSLYSLVTFTFITPFKFIQPLKIVSPVSIFLGNASPVNAVVSTFDLPSTTHPV